MIFKSFINTRQSSHQIDSKVARLLNLINVQMRGSRRVVLARPPLGDLGIPANTAYFMYVASHVINDVTHKYVDTITVSSDASKYLVYRNKSTSLAYLSSVEKRYRKITRQFVPLHSNPVNMNVFWQLDIANELQMSGQFPNASQNFLVGLIDEFFSHSRHQFSTRSNEFLFENQRLPALFGIGTSLYEIEGQVMTYYKPFIFNLSNAKKHLNNIRLFREG